MGIMISIAIVYVPVAGILIAWTFYDEFKRGRVE